MRASVGGAGVSTQIAPLKIVAVGTVEPVELAARHRMAADEARVVAGVADRRLDRADIGDGTDGLGQRPLDLIGHRQYGHGDECDRGVAFESGGVDRPHLERPFEGRRVGILAAHPPTRLRNPSAIEPPTRPSPITLATRPELVRFGSLTGADRTGASVRRPPLLAPCVHQSTAHASRPAAANGR